MNFCLHTSETTVAQLLRSTLTAIRVYLGAPSTGVCKVFWSFLPKSLCLMALLVLAQSLGISSSTFAAAPSLDHLYPVALQRGTTNAVTAIGKFELWPPKIWVDSPGISFHAETNNGAFKVIVAPNAPAGPHLVRAYDEQGSSGPRFLIVTDQPQLAEQEPNDHYARPQKLDPLPVWLNGRLDKSGDVDSYAVTLEAGQTLMASVQAFVLASPVDGALRLLDSQHVEMAFNHDADGIFDPRLIYTTDKAGTYVLQVFGFDYPATSDVKFTGNAKCVYRLHVAKGPFLTHTWPLGVQRGTHTPLQLISSNLAESISRQFNFDGSRLKNSESTTSLRLPWLEDDHALPVSDGPEIIEHEPNDRTADANAVQNPGAVSGCIERLGDEDRFSFPARKGEKLLIDVQAASLGFPLDPRLRIEDQNGKELIKRDDAVGVDLGIEWSPPADGTYMAAISNVLHRGGPENLYRLSIRRAVPGYKATVADSTFSIEPGKTNDVKITVSRLHDFKAKLKVVMRDLPPGIHAAPVDVSEKGGETVIKLVADDDAKPFSGLFAIAVGELDAAKELRVVVELTSSGINNGVPNGFNRLVIEQTDLFWLTITTKPKPKPEDVKK